MSLAVFVVTALLGAALGWLTQRRSGSGAVIGLTGLVFAVLAAISIDPGDSLTFGSIALVASDYLRLFLVLGSLAGLGLEVASLAGGERRHGAPVTLLTLAVSAVTLALTDAATAFVAGTTVGVVAALLTILPTGERTGAIAGIRQVRAVVIAGAMALAAAAWMGRDLTDLDAQPVVYGLAYLAVALAVAIRMGAIPFHLWAARLTDVVPESGLPVTTILAAAPFAIVGVTWMNAQVTPLLVDLGAERGVLLAIAVGSIVLAALAAMLQEDLEHVVGYSIVGDAAVILLGLVALGSEVSAPTLVWILAVVVGRSAFAAWAAALRFTMGTGRLREMHGWTARSPMLGLAFALIVVASVGIPGWAAFEARSVLIGLAIDGPLSALVAIGTLAPLAYYGRMVAIGLARPDGPPDPRISWRIRITPVNVMSLRGWWATTWETNRGFSIGLVALLLALLAAGTSAGVFGGPAEAAAFTGDTAVAPAGGE
jgi:NADH:ubiquinone oxidoreductase subunit 2 (subunit N)